MEKKLKVIDLLNKMANKEEVPKKIKVFSQDWEKCDIVNDDYYCKFTDEFLFECINASALTDEVEIIEEKPKKIKEIDLKLDKFTDSYYDTALVTLLEQSEKIRNAVNYLLEKEDD